ncbi:hypothetical protein D3C75_883840 [compost metagenome]
MFDIGQAGACPLLPAVFLSLINSLPPDHRIPGSFDQFDLTEHYGYLSPADFGSSVLPVPERQ